MQNNTFSRLFVGQNFITLREVDSTNNYLKNELTKSTPLPEGTVIMADHQYAGRGQLNNTWHSEAGKNLTFSLLLCPSFLNIDNQFILNKALSIAINEFLSQFIGNHLNIKWPNDIYYKDDKLGGILIENILQGSKWKYAIVGIGLNINQTMFPNEVKDVTSLCKILHTDYDLQKLLFQLCSYIEINYLKLKASKVDEINAKYLNKLYRLNEWHFYKASNEVIKGKIIGVDNRGCLLMETTKAIRTFDLKEIEFLKTLP